MATIDDPEQPASRELPSAPGHFVVLEGIDGSGTTTQLRLVAARLRATGVQVLETCEPTDRPAGRLLRSALRGQIQFPPDAVALLFAADRMDHLVGEIEPALARGETVLCDRYVGSSLIYQSQFSQPTFVRAINGQARSAHLTVVVDVPADVAAARRAARGGPEELFDAGELQARLARAYHALPSLLPGERVVLVDGTRSPEEVAELVLAHIGALEAEASDRTPPPAPARDRDENSAVSSGGSVTADTLLRSLLTPRS